MYSSVDSLLAVVMMIDMNGPGIEAVDEVKSLILESVHVWKDYKSRVPSVIVVSFLLCPT